MLGSCTRVFNTSLLNIKLLWEGPVFAFLQQWDHLHQLWWHGNFLPGADKPTPVSGLMLSCFLFALSFRWNWSCQLERAADKYDTHFWEGSCQKGAALFWLGDSGICITGTTAYNFSLLFVFLFLSPPQYNADKAIVDSGTTLLRLPEKVFSAVVQAIARTSLVRKCHKTCSKKWNSC